MDVADLLLRHCAAARATAAQLRLGVELLDGQVAGMEAFIRQQQTARAVVDLPDTCKNVPPDDCGRQHPQGLIETRMQGSMCAGCAQMFT